MRSMHAQSSILLFLSLQIKGIHAANTTQQEPGATSSTPVPQPSPGPTQPDVVIGEDLARFVRMQECIQKDGLVLWKPIVTDGADPGYASKGIIKLEDVVALEGASEEDYAYHSRMAVMAVWANFYPDKIPGMIKVGTNASTPWCIKADTPELTLTGAKTADYMYGHVNGTNYEKSGADLSQLLADGRTAKNVGPSLAKWPWLIGHVLRDIWGKNYVDGDICRKGDACGEVTGSFLAALAGQEIGQAGIRASVREETTKAVMAKAEQMPVVLLT